MSLVWILDLHGSYVVARLPQSALQDFPMEQAHLEHEQTFGIKRFITHLIIKKEFILLLIYQVQK